MQAVSQLIRDLKNMYYGKNRFENFGDVLLLMEAHGIRGMSANISFDFPITVITGKNGSGKSTLGQLALCCYRYKIPGESSHNTKNYYSLGNFFIKSNLDPEPYTSDAYLKYSYIAPPEAKGLEQVSLFDLGSLYHTKENTIRKVNSDWGGYRQRPDRKCIYFGMGFFVPHHEMGDRIYLDPKTCISERRSFSSTARKLSADILGTQYNSVEVATISNQSRKAEMGFASRFGARYSENHMGCGEARLIRMIDAMESAPEKSLIVIEEPETALHQDAQHNLAVYFLEVCKRKRHQIIVTTHSPTIVSVMPLEARKKVERTTSGTIVENNPTIAEIIADLSDGHQKSLLLYVEDEFSKKLLIEIIRKFSPELTNAVSIAAVGDKGDVLHAVQYTRKHNVKAIGIRDEQHTANEPDYVYAYPSEKAPELEIFGDSAVSSFLNEHYNIDIASELFDVENYHKISECLASKCYVDRSTIEVQCIQAYIAHQSDKKFSQLIHAIKSQC